MPSSSVLVLYSNGDGSSSIRESARSPCVHRNAFNESECVHHELTALLLIFLIEIFGLLINGGWTNGGNEYKIKRAQLSDFNANGPNEG
jgi:hypothetical protein